MLFGVALFLVIQALPALVAPADKIQGGEGFFAYIWPIVIGTLIAAVIALVIATPDRHRRRAVHLALRPAQARLRPGLRD